VRDVLSQRWLKTEQTCRQRNAKRVYYLSMEFLLGRALANNISNLLIDPEAQQFCRHHQIDPLQIIEQGLDAGLGNGGLGRFHKSGEMFAVTFNLSFVEYNDGFPRLFCCFHN